MRNEDVLKRMSNVGINKEEKELAVHKLYTEEWLMEKEEEEESL